MAPLGPIFRNTYRYLGAIFVLYGCALILLTNTWLQRQCVFELPNDLLHTNRYSVFYAHKINTAYFYDLNKPEQWGFASKQKTPCRTNDYVSSQASKKD